MNDGDVFAMDGDARVFVVRWMQENEEAKALAARIAGVPLALWPDDIDVWIESQMKAMTGGTVRDNSFREVYDLMSKEFQRHLIAAGWQRPEEIPSGEWAW